MSFASNIRYYSDNELITLYKKTGDKVYVGELFKRYSHLVLGMCIQYFKDKDTAKDMLIRIFEKLFDELKRREVENFKAWLTFVVRNFCISEIRKLQTEQARISEYSLDLKSEPLNDEMPEDKIEKQISELENALKELNPFQKKCIELFYFKNMSYSQITDITGYSINEVKSYIQNGKRNLRLILTEVK
ncbi:MAG TPA: sigma-70 family RNA polymerase sigma factor [Bacteroidia bacterium]|jgi:RNA polymerase sigma-70 factor (ECF subfamily)